MIDSQLITKGDFIGKGHFGEVYKGILNGGFVALKKVREKSNVNEASSRQQLNDEVGTKNLISQKLETLGTTRPGSGTGCTTIQLSSLLAWGINKIEIRNKFNF